MSNGKEHIENQEGNYLYKRKSLHDGYSNDSSFKEKQDISVHNVKENPNDVKIQYDVQSLDCPDIVTDHSNDQSADDELIGHHETQLVETSEADLHKYLTSCTKNPGHKEFIPVGTFSLEDLPEGHRDIDLYEFIKAIADLTVRVDVRMTSQNRPEVLPKTTNPYPFYNMRGSTTLRRGSGRMDTVLRFTDGVNQNKGKHWKNLRNCWCKNCEGSDSPNNVWWEFEVTTAAHVVFDDNEARLTCMRLFYDRDDSPEVSVDKVSFVSVDILDDKCRLKCVTCEKNVGNEVEKMWEHYTDVWWKVRGKYKKFRENVNLTIIVSHPHGCSKQVSVGQWKDKVQVVGRYNKFTYTTCTCPGSSGANVHCVGYNDGALLYTDLVHSGSFKSGLNISGADCVFE